MYVINLDEKEVEIPVLLCEKKIVTMRGVLLYSPYWYANCDDDGDGVMITNFFFRKFFYFLLPMPNLPLFSTAKDAYSI